MARVNYSEKDRKQAIAAISKSMSQGMSETAAITEYVKKLRGGRKPSANTLRGWVRGANGAGANGRGRRGKKNKSVLEILEEERKQLLDDFKRAAERLRSRLPEIQKSIEQEIQNQKKALVDRVQHEQESLESRLKGAKETGEEYWKEFKRIIGQVRGK